MAMKDCPDCGAPNFDRGDTCPNCGADLRDRAAKTAADAPAAAVRGALPAKGEAPAFPKPTAPGKRVPLPKILIPAAAAVLTVLVLALVLIPGGRHLELPYGIRTYQSAREIDNILRENGFEKDRVIGADKLMWYTYKPMLLYDDLATPLLTEFASTGIRYLEFTWTDADGTGDHPSPRFLRVREELTRQYGELGEVNPQGIWWRGKDLRLGLFYDEKGGFEIRYYIHEPSGNKQ